MITKDNTLATYRLSAQNLLVVMNHLPVYDIEVIEVSSETIDNQLIYTMQLSGEIPESEMSHFNTGDQFIERI